MEPYRVGIPFFPNTEDNTHCVQACLKMVLKHFEPEQEFTWDELDTASHKQPGKWTWGYAASCWMADRGYEVVTYGTFDPHAFIADPEGYMRVKFGEEKMRANYEHSDINLAVADATQFTAHAHITLVQRIPTRDDILTLMRDGYVVTVGINSKVLKGEPGYIGHRIVITGVTDTDVYSNDPGITAAQKDRVAPWTVFEKAWAYPDESNKGITAYRLKKA